MDGTSKTIVSSEIVSSEAEQTSLEKERAREIFGWFAKVLPPGFFESLKQDLEIVEKRRIFTLKVTTWLMIMQRLSAHGTLATAVSELIHGNGRELLEDCKRVQEENISASTGAYSQARQEMPVEAARRIAERTFQQLHEIPRENGLSDRLFVLDGSSIRLVNTPSVVKAYPPSENQYGETHWPVARIAVMHHVVTGLAMAPYFGPMYGPDAVSEQALAEALIDRLPDSSVLIGDRNFGVFSVVWYAHRWGHQVLVRLTKARARRLSGGNLTVGSDQAVVWQPSRDDLRAHKEIPADARIEGRLIVAQSVDGKQPLYLFTTLREPAETVVELYKERWNIETDLRTLKEQVRLHTIPARSPDLIACEILIAVASYNLIRAVMSAAARQTGVEPRRLSFSRSKEAFWAFVRAVAHLDSESEFERHWKLLLRSIGQCKLPKRKRPPAPRAVWPKKQNFPSRKAKKHAPKN